MEPYGGRAEAERWLGIAEKLLNSRDLLGSRTFAVRARESDPRLESAERILAVVDTILAGDKRINDHHHDWYAILQLSRHNRDSELIATQYRRLALLVNPSKNALPFAADAFHLISDAWSVLSDSAKKSRYDNEINQIGLTRPQEHRNQIRRSPRKSNVANRGKRVDEDVEIGDEHVRVSGFWTACPYCYYMYEYARVYEDCALRCQNCRRAFQALVVPSPPEISEGKEDSNFCCWGFYPLGLSVLGLDKNKDGVTNWAPFTPMFNWAQGGEGNVNVEAPKKKNVGARKSSAPRIYIDDDDDDEIYVEASSEDSDDDDWGRTSRKKRKVKDVKGKGLAGRNGRKQMEKGKSAKGGSGGNLQGGSVMQEGMSVPNVSKIETRGSSSKRTGKGSKEMGKLDLNVEFSNEVEEPVRAVSEGNEAAGNGEEDGIGFFEGLDEFLSSLPILSAVGDDKGKAT